MNKIRRADAFGGSGMCVIIATALLLFVSTLRGGRSSDKWEVDVVVLSGPLEHIRSWSIPVISLLLCFLFFLRINEIRSAGGRYVVAWSPLFIIFFNLVVLFRDFRFGLYSSSDFLMSIVGFFGLAMVFVFYPIKSFRSLVNDAALVVFLAFSFFTFSSLYEALFGNLQNVYYSGRFNGVANHPVYCGVLSSLGVVSALHLLLARFFKGIWRISVFVLLIIGVGFIVASGTRTGVIVLSAALLWMARGYQRRSNYLISLMALGACCLVAVYSVFHLLGVGETGGGARILSMENTRRDSWLYLLESFWDSPYFGVPGAGAESSILMALARGGVIFGGFFFVGLGLFSYNLYRVILISRSFHPLRGLVALASALLVLSIFEGFLNDRFSFFNVTFYLVAASLSSAVHSRDQWI